jgi:hypothetical protein
MKAAVAVAALFSLAASVAATPTDNKNVVPRDYPRGYPSGFVEIFEARGMLTARDIARRDACVEPCNAGCEFCGDQGCLENCQLSWYVCLSKRFSL